MQTQAFSHARTTAGFGLVLIFCASVLWGTVGVVTQALYAISDTNPLSIGFFRLALASPALIAACWWFCGAAMFQVRRRHWPLMLLIGLLTAAYQVCLFSAIRYVGVSIAVVITLCTAPVFVALVSTRLFNERLTRWTVLALGCALGGTLLLSGGGAGLGVTLGATLLGVTLALGSALGYGGMALTVRVLAPHYHPLQTLAFGFTSGALMLLPFALAQSLVVSYSPLGWLLLFHLGLLPTALAYVLFLFGIRVISATTASIVTLCEPLTATLLAWLLFDERLGGAALVGGGLLLGAILLLYRNEVSRR